MTLNIILLLTSLHDWRLWHHSAIVDERLEILNATLLPINKEAKALDLGVGSLTSETHQLVRVESGRLVLVGDFALAELYDLPITES